MGSREIAAWCLIALGLVLLTVSGRLDLLLVALPVCFALWALWTLRCAAGKNELAR